MADFYGVLGVARTASRRRDQEGVPQARDEVSSRPQQRREGSRGAVQGDHRGVRRAARSAEARGVRSLRRGRAPRRRRRGFHHVDLSEALDIFMRDFGGFGGLEELFGGGARRGGAARRRRRQDDRAAHARRSRDRRREEDQRRSCSIRASSAAASGAEPGSKSQTCATCSGQRRGAARAALVLRTVRDASRRVRRATAKGRSSRRRARSAAAKDGCAASASSPCRFPPGVATGQYMTMRGVGQRRRARRPARRRARAVRGRRRSALRARRRGSLHRSARDVSAARARRARSSVPTVVGSHDAATFRPARRAARSFTCAAAACRA